jgi:hypothetical protein
VSSRELCESIDPAPGDGVQALGFQPVDAFSPEIEALNLAASVRSSPLLAAGLGQVLRSQAAAEHIARPPVSTVVGVLNGGGTCRPVHVLSHRLIRRFGVQSPWRRSPQLSDQLICMPVDTGW